MLNFREDATAFRAFISEHQDRVFNLVLKLVQHVQDAEEITQDVFVDVFRKPEAFRGDAAVTTWLYRIATNKCIDHLRKQQRKNRWFLSSFFGADANDTVHEPSHNLHPAWVTENREQLTILFKALHQLPEKQQAAWVLSEMENMPYKEICVVMNLSLSSVESLLVRARKNLKQLLTDLYGKGKMD
jgi:RNA polymerase sigma-70 factor (ECF subfamily)